MDRACSVHGGDENTYKILAGKPEGKRSLLDGRIILK
jgi:hypothetical protein